MSQEVMELFNALESSRPLEVDGVKAEFSSMFNSVRDSWLVNGLITYHLRTGSVRAIDVLVRAPEHHAKYLFERLCDGIRGENQNRQSVLALLGHVVRRQPLWLHQMASHRLMKELLCVLRSERNIATLMSALLALITLLPMIPVLVGHYFQEIFEVFKRLAAWDSARVDDPADYGRREHLQLGLYGLFYNLYGMYPCNFIGYLRNEYGPTTLHEKREIFNHTIKPMLETVRMHPSLITASKSHETQGARWQNMEHHDILVECRRFSLEGTDRHRNFDGEESRFRSRCGTDVASLTAAPHFESKASSSAPNLTEAQTQMKTTVTISHVDPNSTAYISKTCDMIEPGSESWFSLTDGCGSGAAPSAPHTPLPIAGTTMSHFADVPSSRTPSSFLHSATLDSGSPPEAAIEATPENTPIKDLRTRFNFPNNPQTVRAIRGLQHLPSHVVPSQSQPPSPLKKEPSPFGRVSELSEGQDGRKDRLTRVLSERVQAETSARQSGGSPHKKQYHYQPHIGTSVPNSPIPIGTGAPATGSTDWVIAKPKPKKDGVTLENYKDNYPDSNKEDREVTELTMRSPSAIRDDSITPVFGAEMRKGYPDPYSEEWGEEDLACEGTETQCRERNHGLHMPQSCLMMDFAKRVTKRIRFYSQCVPDLSCGSFPKSSATESRKCLKEGKLIKVSSCPDFRKTNSSVRTISTQTVDAWPSAYEFLLSDMFQGLCDRPGKQKQPQFLPEAERVSSFSLCEQLDKYIESLYMRGSGPTTTDRTQLERLTEQLQLMHLHLLYERHRKEVHAVRNRRLLGKCRKNRATEEENTALADRMKALEIENDELRQQINKQNSNAQDLEVFNRKNNQSTQENLALLQASLRDEKRTREKLSADFEDLKKKSSENSIDVQHLHAQIFDLTQRLERAKKGSDASEKLAEHVRILERELLICGERESRIADAVAASPLANDIYLSKLLKQYKEELVSAQESLNVVMSKLETSQAREAELETQLNTKESQIYELKRRHRLAYKDYDLRIDTFENKYKDLIHINQRLECRILELLPYAPCSPSNSVAGSREATSPHSSPLSASLTSSEGPLAAHVALNDVTHLHHLLEQPSDPEENNDTDGDLQLMND